MRRYLTAVLIGAILGLLAVLPVVMWDTWLTWLRAYNEGHVLTLSAFLEILIGHFVWVLPSMVIAPVFPFVEDCTRSRATNSTLVFALSLV